MRGSMATTEQLHNKFETYAGSLQSELFSACHNGKTYHIIGCKITFSRKTNKLSVLALLVVNLAFVACGKIYT